MRITNDMTLGEIYALPEFAEEAQYFVYGPEDVMTKRMDIVVKEWPKMEYGLGESMIDGLNRLSELLRDGTEHRFPVYDDCSDDPYKKDVHLVWFPAKNRKSGSPYVIICAGGGYTHVWSLTESYPVAAHLNDLGYDAFVLTYRVGVTPILPKPLEDVAAAVRFLQANEARFGIDGSRYIVNGYSAGGHLCTAWGAPVGYLHYGCPKPQALFSIYPACSLGEYTEGPGNAFLTGMFGPGFTRDTLAAWSAPQSADKNYPPSYLVCCEDDNEVPFMSSVVLKEKLDELGIPAKLEVGKRGRHGYGEGRGTDVEGWIERAVAFVEGEASPFRPMRRRKQQISRAECDEVLADTTRGVLALMGDDGYPYAVPMDFYYDADAGKIYFHGAKRGKKIDSLAKNSRVSFCVTEQGEKLDGNWYYTVRSVICFGNIRKVDDPAEVETIARKLGAKFTPDSGYIEREIERSAKGVQVLELVIEHMTGKLVNER